MTVASTDERTVTPLEAFGMQREVCLRATHDHDGHPVGSPLDPGGLIYRISGPVDRDRLVTAAELVLDNMDALRARLRWGGQGYVLVPDPAQVLPVTVVDLRPYGPRRRDEVLAAMLARHASLLGDLRDGPLATVLLAQLAADDHVLMVGLDHSVSDRLSTSMATQLIARTYSRLVAGDHDGAVAAAAMPSFLEYARAVQDDTERRAVATRFWQRAVEAPPFSATMPGCQWRSWRERQATTRVVHEVSPRTWEAIRQATQVTGTPLNYLYYAAVTVVLAGVEDREFVPITWARHGRTPEIATMLAPLWESLITVAPAAGYDRLGDWVTAFMEANLASPPFGHLTLTDFASLDEVMEYRRLTINFWMPFTPVRFADLRAHSMDVPMPPTYPPSVTPHNIGIRLLVEGIDRLVVLLHHDPTDLASGEMFLDAVHRVVELIAWRPMTSLAEAMKVAGAVLRGEG